MSILKIDNPDVFDKLLTNISTEKELKDAGSKIVISNYNYFKKQLKIDSNGELEWVKLNIQKIIDKVINQQPATQRIRLEALANLLILIDKFAFKKTVKALFLKTKDIQNNIDEVKGENQYNENEKISLITYDELVKLRDEYEEKEGLKENIIYLILCINTLVPPLRLEYLQTADREGIIYNDKCNDATNYMLSIKDEEFDIDDMILHLGNDKVSHKVGCIDLYFRNYETRRNVIFINGNKLKEVIRKSMQLYPRKYVIPSIYNIEDGMTVNMYYKLLKDVIGHKTTQNAIRKAFINHWYQDKHKLSYNNKKLISVYMRNSVNMAESTYKKIN